MNATSRVVGPVVILWAYLKYVWNAHIGQNRQEVSHPFHRFLLQLLRDRKIVASARPFSLVYVMVSSLAEQDFVSTLSVPREYIDELPWVSISSRLVRKTIETAVVFLDERVARELLGRLRARSSIDLPTIRSTSAIIRWRFAEFTVADAMQVDFRAKYFVVFGFVDSYFKGNCCELLGRSREAREYYAISLSLASPEFVEWRANIESRLSKLAETLNVPYGQ